MTARVCETCGRTYQSRGSHLEECAGRQESLLDPTWPCARCSGRGEHADNETGGVVKCRVCEGAGYVLWDPDDTKELGF